jgi:hypothetical protein
MIRPPAVSGSFYPSRPDELRALLAEMTAPAGAAREAIAVLVPHAGYIYSGAVAGRVYASVRLPRRYVILCPNHTGWGTPLSINLGGSWRTPLGEVPVDAELAADLAGRCGLLRDDARAHAREHSLEVQLPFLQHLAGEFRFVPVCVGTHDLPALLEFGEAIAGAVRNCPDPVLVVISSDMTHYEPAEVARQKDRRAIERIEALDASGLHERVHGEGISMCGIAPAVAGIAAARGLGARRAELVRYANSGDVSGDFDRVVGYAGMVFGPDPA